MDQKEVELKLELAPDDLRRLSNHPLVRSTKTGPPVRQLLHSVYFDTPDLILHQGGATLRVRHVGGRRIQTIKARAAATAGLFARSEWEDDIAGDVPEIELARRTALAPLLRRPGVAESLRPVFSTRVRRTTYTLDGGAWEVKLMLDVGRVEASGGAVPIREAELELVRGQPGQLYAIALDLHHAIPMRLGTASKSDRGFALVGGARPVPVRAKPVVLARDMTVGDAFAAIASNCLQHLMANEVCVREVADAEGVHQMRVALRRLGAARAIFQPALDPATTEAVAEGARWLGALLGRARDADVFIAGVLDPAAEYLAGESGLGAMREVHLQRRREYYDQLLVAVASPQFTTTVLVMGAWAEDAAGRPESGSPSLAAAPVGPFAAMVLDKVYRRAIKAGRKFKNLDAAERHHLRIRLKKLRYAAEFLVGLFPDGEKASRRFLKMLGRLQDQLGALNDAQVARATLAQGSWSGELAWTAGAIAGWHTAGTMGLLKDARGMWLDFVKAPTFWRKD